MMMRKYKASANMHYHQSQITFHLSNPDLYSIGDVSTDWDDKKTVIDFISQGGHFPQLAIFHASNRLKDDFDIVAKAVKKDPWALVYASDRLKGHKELVELAIEKEPLTLQIVDAAWQDNPELVHRAINLSSGWAFQYASPRLRDDDDIVDVATEKQTSNLQWAAERFRKDFNYVLYLALENSQVFEHAHEDLKSDKESVLTILGVCCKSDWEMEGVVEHTSQEIQELCKGQNPIKALETAIAYEKLQFTLTQKAPEPKELKRGLKI